MRISCSRCKTQYDLPDEKLARGAAKIRCSQCSHVFVVRRRGTEPPAPATPQEASFDDFDFGTFEAPAPPPPIAAPEHAPAPAEPAEEPAFLTTSDELPALGELDLGEFDVGNSDLRFEEPPSGQPSRPPEAAPTERVQREDLVSSIPSTKEVPVQTLSEDIPRLDLQRGPRRPEAPAKGSPLLARDRRRSPLFWIVVLAVLGTAAWTGYNAYRKPEALTFLNPARIRELWKYRDVAARLAAEELQGYAQDLPGGRHIYVIRGKVVNKSGRSQGLIRVKGSLFASDGTTAATSEVYCGNVLTDRELAVLPRATIEARLQNQVGEALSNVDIAPGGKVPFMLVFPSPPAKVQSFNVLVSDWRPGGGS